MTHFPEHDVFVADDGIFPAHAHGSFDFREIFLQERTDSDRNMPVCERIIVIRIDDRVDRLCAFMESVVRYFMLDEQVGPYAKGQGHGQAQDFDHGEYFLLFDIPEGDIKIIPQHGKSPKKGEFQKWRHGRKDLGQVPDIGLCPSRGAGQIRIEFGQIAGRRKFPVVFFHPGRDPLKDAGRPPGIFLCHFSVIRTRNRALSATRTCETARPFSKRLFLWA